MAIRIAEYAFIIARQFATWEIGKATIPMPRFSVIYVKKTDKTPKKTAITFTFPDGQKVIYESENMIRKEHCEMIQRLLRKGKTPEEISDLCDYNLSYVREVEESILQKA
jgi:hypothetical protein